MTGSILSQAQTVPVEAISPCRAAASAELNQLRGEEPDMVVDVVGDGVG